MKIVPANVRVELSKALIHADYEKTVDIIQESKIDCNSIIEPKDNFTILHEAINVLNDYQGSESQIETIRFLLKNGANPDNKTTGGHNCLHLALEHHNLSAVALILIREGNADINATEGNGRNPIFIAINKYGLTWRPEQKEVNELRFQIIEELLKRGADLDKINNHGISSRRWLEISKDQRLHDLISKYDKSDN
jgi:ankyrin repeat protein